MPDYKQQLVSSTVWNAVESYSMTGIQLICTFILARYLTPADFGILGMLVVFTAISQTIIDSGFSAALIREKHVSNEDYSSVFFFNLFLSLALYILLSLCSGTIADFYHQPILRSICSVSFLILPIQSLTLVQITKLRKELQFKKLCIISLSASIIASIIAIISASYLKNVWALVIQNITAISLKTLFIWVYGKWWPTIAFSWTTIKKYFSFSKNVMMAGIIGSVFNNVYSLLIGRFYTASDLGYFSQACRMRDVASYASTGVIQNVTYPILARINNNGENLKAAYKKVIGVTLTFVGCIMALAMTVAEDVYELLMGDAVWRISGYYFILLGISGILYPLHAVNQNVLMVKGKSKTLLFLEITRRTIMLIILAVTVHFGISVFVFGNSIYSILLLFLNLHFCGKPIHYTLFQQLKDVSPILFRQGIMVAMGITIACFLDAFNIYVRLIITFISTLGIGVFLFLQTPYFREMLNLMISKYMRHGK